MLFPSFFSSINFSSLRDFRAGYNARGFLTKAEKIELLKEYKENLDKEAKGVAEKIEDLEEE